MGGKKRKKQKEKKVAVSAHKVRGKKSREIGRTISRGSGFECKVENEEFALRLGHAINKYKLRPCPA